MPTTIVKHSWMSGGWVGAPVAPVAPVVTQGALPPRYRRRRPEPFVFDDETLQLLRAYLRLKVNKLE